MLNACRRYCSLPHSCMCVHVTGHLNYWCARYKQVYMSLCCAPVPCMRSASRWALLMKLLKPIRSMLAYRASPVMTVILHWGPSFVCQGSLPFSLFNMLTHAIYFKFMHPLQKGEQFLYLCEQGDGMLPLKVNSGLMLMSSLVSSRCTAQNENSCEPADWGADVKNAGHGMHARHAEEHWNVQLAYVMAAHVFVRPHPARFSIAIGR